ncbi:hypothetical protein FGO68_gene15940 [Halteria grandinella]|uniref:Uncharacterized protein n=1 Tax=Halteria grandinella TaxID=5974 RepID=A0A8J8T424_HALGN|nr:hypothetical protein FGO68_gene15940 [Halteria grandinella]
MRTTAPFLPSYSQASLMLRLTPNPSTQLPSPNTQEPLSPSPLQTPSALAPATSPLVAVTKPAAATPTAPPQPWRNGALTSTSVSTRQTIRRSSPRASASTAPSSLSCWICKMGSRCMGRTQDRCFACPALARGTLSAAL